MLSREHVLGFKRNADFMFTFGLHVTGRWKPQCTPWVSESWIQVEYELGLNFIRRLLTKAWVQRCHQTHASRDRISFSEIEPLQLFFDSNSTFQREFIRSRTISAISWSRSWASNVHDTFDLRWNCKTRFYIEVWDKLRGHRYNFSLSL